MAKVVETVERDGVQIRVYDNGMEQRVDNGRMIKAPDSAVIRTTEKSHELQRKRREKTQALLRVRITEAHNRKMQPVRTSAGAFADSGALLYEEVVLNADAYPRDRIEAWEKLGKYADVLPADIRGGGGAEPTATAQAAAIGAASALKFIQDVIAAKATIQSADVIDIRNEITADEE